ncbi:hypothetical protein [Streptosporangium sp. NBC_01756]|uniref:hypothetical protein n=1 Tax=Streptosporangium sp. NBC_01756 TaxID=2975950 RepID=UPI002DDC502C|nr:hypothetical protein [Streptosporangium sp. NBC_01756]WSC82839.1 hypothetical protein OIE48_20605 [Streptosporangium sp. NBC_01756]
MKQKGFTYIPFVRPPLKETETQRKMEEGDLDAMREFRAKYGYQVFAAHVYPDDLASGAFVEEAIPADPNDRYRGSLNETQFNAYKEADQACFGKAVKEVLHKTSSAEMNYLMQRLDMIKRLKERELDGDPKIAELAVPFGDCLKSKGYPVPSLKPTAMARRGMEAFRAKEAKFGPGENGSIPDLAADQARPYLAREIKDALDDLECGKDFYAAYTPKEREIKLRVTREFGEVNG